MRKFFSVFVIVMMFGVSLFAQNIMISDENSPNEPSIMFDPLNPAHGVAGANLNNVYSTTDTGRTWVCSELFSQYGVWGDPVIDVDGNGHFYFLHLSNPQDGNWIDRIVCQKSQDVGNTWSQGTYAGLNGEKVQDKQWTSIDRTSDVIYMTWTQFDAYDSSSPEDSSQIMFSKSIDGGETWSDAKVISNTPGDCLDDDNTVEGATPAVGPNGEIYVSWAGPEGLVFNRSFDGGDTWLDDELAVDPMPGGWTYDIPGIFRCNGLPVTKCDTSGGEFNGTIYVNWTDQRNGGDDTDVWLVKSTDHGDTWSEPVRVNNDEPGNHQFLTWMDVDQSSGDLFFVFYDRRNYSDTRTDVYAAYSNDGGQSFLNKRISESAFVPSPGVFFGDYNNIYAQNGIVRPIWTRLNDGELSIWTHVDDVDFYLTDKQQVIQSEALVAEQYPNPVRKTSYISFKLHSESPVSVLVYDQSGRLVSVIKDNETMGYGKYIIPIHVEDLNLLSGEYNVQLLIDGKEKVMRMLVID